MTVTTVTRPVTWSGGDPASPRAWHQPTLSRGSSLMVRGYRPEWLLSAWAHMLSTAWTLSQMEGTRSLSPRDRKSVV